MTDKNKDKNRKPMREEYLTLRRSNDMISLTSHSLFFTALLLGWGAAIPFGPINLEIMRRNISYGTRFGLALGIGACLADMTFVFLLSLGALMILSHGFILKIVGIVGACILAWFGYQSFRAQPFSASTQQGIQPKSPLYSIGEGYVLTLINPFTLLFWASVSSQLLSLTQTQAQSIWLAVWGVCLGTLSWIVVFNGILHVTRHRFSLSLMRYLNIVGGCMLFGFAAYALYRSL